MKALKLGAALIAVLALVGCNEIKGTMKVKSSFILNLKKEGKTYAVPTGDIPVELKLKQNDHYIQIKLKDANGDTKEARFHFPENMTIPTSYGKLNVSAAQSGQNVDLNGLVDTNIEESMIYNATEDCSETYTHNVCGWHTNEETGESYYSCEDVQETVYGDQQVSYHYETTTKTIDVQLLLPGSSSVVATIFASKSDEDKIYDYIGNCNIHGPYWP